MHEQLKPNLAIFTALTIYTIINPAIKYSVS